MFGSQRLVLLFAAVVGFFAFSSLTVQAATRTWDGEGSTNNWSEDANWSGDVEPTTGDTAVFDSTSTKDATIDASITIGAINMNSGYSGTITQASGAVVTITTLSSGAADFVISSGTFIGGDSTIEVRDQFTVSGGSFTSTTGTLLIYSGDFTVSSGTFEPSTGTVEFTNIGITYNVNVSETFYNVNVNLLTTNTLTITSGDTMVVTGTLTLTDGVVATGTIDARANITQASTFDGGSATIEFGGADAQIYTVNGGSAPTIEFDAAEDASDSLVFNAATTVANLVVTAGFSGTIPITNPGDSILTFNVWTQAAGTYDASAQTQWTVIWTSITGGTWIPPETVYVTGGFTDWDVNSSQTLENLVIQKSSGNRFSLGSGDKLVVTGTLTLTDGVFFSGTIEAQGDITQASTFDGEGGIVDFAGAGAQTYTINGGQAPTIRLNEAADASDSIVFNAATTVTHLNVTSGFSGAIPITNSGNYTLTFNTWTQAAGTYDASAQTQWNVIATNISGGTWTPPATVVITGGFTTWDVNSSQTLNNLTVSKSNGNRLDMGSGDKLVVTGTLTLTDGVFNSGTIEAQGNITQGANFDGDGGIVDFAGAGAQTYTVSGGQTPTIRLNEAADAGDSIVFNAATTITNLNVTSGFSGTIPITNSGNYTLTFNTWTQAAGSYDASAQTAWTMLNLAITGGTFVPPTTVSATGFGSSTWDVNTTQTFTNVTIAKATGWQVFLGSGDTFVTTGLLSLSDGVVQTGTLQAQGNVTVGSGYDGGSAALTFAGSATQTFTLTGATGLFDADITVDKSGGQVNLASALVVNANSQDLIIAEGTFNTAGQNLTVNGTSGTLTVQDGGTLKLYGTETFTLNASQPTLSTGSTVHYTGDGDSASDTITVTSLKSTYHHLTIASTDGATDTFQLGAALDVNGNFALSAGTFDVTASNYAMTVGGNWSNSGTFNGRSGTVTLDGSSQTLTGATTFYNLTKSVSSAATLTLPASTTQTISNTLTLSGASGQLLSVRSSTPDTQASIDPQGSRTVQYVDVKDNNNIDDAEITCGPGCVDSGNNTNWALPSVEVSAISGNTTEAGGTATFTVVLNTQPSANVSLSLSSSDTTEGTVSPSSVTFTDANWNTPQTVTVTGVNDDLDDGDIAYSIVTAAASSSDESYSGYNAADVSVTNTDNDTAGVTVGAISGNTTEAGVTATFTVVLATEPSANVSIGISSNDTTEGTVSPASLTFTNGNWSTPQTVTVTGVNDDVDDGDIGYTIVLAAATSGDSAYNGFNPSDVSVTNTDNDTAGFTVSAISGNTTEAGGTATYTVVLNSEPTADVSIGVSSNDTTEGTVSPSSLTFTSGNWSSAQTVTVTGVNDNVDDGDIGYTIVNAAAASGDSNYNNLNPNDVSVTNTDNDVAGVTVSAISGNTTEAGGTATFTVVLDAQPTSDVTMSVSSSDTSEGTVAISTLTFTNSDWDEEQTVTVTGANDDLDDGDIAYTIVIGATSSDDDAFDGVNPSDVSVTNTDNDTAGFTVSAISGNTTEANGSATFTVVLTAQPSADVTVGLSSNDTTEGTVSPSSLTFTNSNWATPQTVTVTGVNDDLDDGDISYSIITAAATSGDAAFNGVNPGDVSVTNTDNDTSGFTVSAISGNTTEDGGTATYTIVLTAQPTASVSIGISSNDTTEGTVSPSSVMFTTGNWSSPRTITVTGVNDDVDDGDIAFTIVNAAATSSDTNYNGLNPSDVAVTNTDNDTAGFTISAISGNTTEAGGTATFTVALATQPSADVTFGVSSNDTSEGTVSPSSLTFTNGNWSTPQTVTVTGVNDDLDDGNIAYSIVLAAASSADGQYNNLNPDDVSVTNADNDTAGVSVGPISGDTTEAGGTATFTVVLNTQPTDDVSIGISSNDTTEGTVSPSSVTFTNGNWATPQTVTVTGVNDDLDDGDVVYTIVLVGATSSDGNYNGVNPDDVSVTNTDNDTAGVTVGAISGNTTEAGGTATFTLVLDSEPTANVSIGLSSSDTTEGTVSPSSVTFTNSNWSTPQTVTVTGVNDDLDDGNIAYSIVTAAATSADGTYNGLNPANVSVTNTDNDTSGITVSAISGNTTEVGGTATYTIVLTAQPTASVSIGITSGDTSEGTVSPSSVTFTTSSWATPQTVTITGVNDDVDDGDIAFTIVNAPATSVDSIYNGINPNDVSVTNTDDDVTGVTVSAISGNTTESAGTATFTVVLTSQPTVNISFNLSSSDTTEGTPSPITLTFTDSTWSTPQTVTVTGVNDDLDDGDIAYTIVTGAVSSSDVTYSGFNPNDVSVTNTDNDTAGVTVSSVSGSASEDGDAATFTIVLNTQPTADVTFGISSDNTAEGTVSPSTVTFTSVNWNIPQTITVTGVDDATIDDEQVFNVVIAAAASADGNYTGNNPADVAVTNLDNDRASGSAKPQPVVIEPVVTYTGPQDGEVLGVSALEEITWDTNITPENFINIYVSYDGGAHYSTLVTNTVNDGVYAWVVPNVESDEVVIRIAMTDLAIELADDVSTPFVIDADVEVPDGGAGEGGEGSGTDPLPGVSIVTPHTFIRGVSFPDVYYVDGSMYRHPVLNEQIYFTYKDTWDEVQIVTDATLPTLQVGSPVLPNPGVVLVKVQSLTKVYAVFAGASGETVLRWIKSEEVAEAMYGSDWDTYVIDIPPTFWTKFSFGDDIDAPLFIDMSRLKRRSELTDLSPSGAALPDTDGDGLSDAKEAMIGSDPTNVDTDSDGYPDGLEVANGYSPLRSASR